MRNYPLYFLKYHYKIINLSTNVLTWTSVFAFGGKLGSELKGFRFAIVSSQIAMDIPTTPTGTDGTWRSPDEEGTELV